MTLVRLVSRTTSRSSCKKSSPTRTSCTCGWRRTAIASVWCDPLTEPPSRPFACTNARDHRGWDRARDGSSCPATATEQSRCGISRRRWKSSRRKIRPRS
uniref:(northern house mosquito) hypothetical protein n=1 Tax=Culex pipiens TaxID=7175 RepID=A0A8D8NCU3_CULPI